MGICFTMSGWVVVHGMDESFREEVTGASEWDGGEVHAESVTGETGGGLET